MELPLSVCVVICHLTTLGLTGAAIERKIKEVYGEVISRQMIDGWYTMFFDSSTDFEAEQNFVYDYFQKMHATLYIIL